MRIFLLNDSFFKVKDGQFTQDEKQASIDAAKTSVELSLAEKITACAPSGSIDVTEYDDDIKGHAGTHTPSLVNGVLTWTERDIKLTNEQIELNRQAAYSDPINGSDKHFLEAIRKDALGKTEEAAESRALGIARAAEIVAENPFQ